MYGVTTPMRLMSPYRRRACREASEPIVTLTPARASTRSRSLSLPSRPSQKVSDDIPMIRWSGSQVMTRSIAAISSPRTVSISLVKSSSPRSGSFGMWMRPK